MISVANNESERTSVLCFAHNNGIKVITAWPSSVSSLLWLITSTLQFNSSAIQYSIWWNNNLSSSFPVFSWNYLSFNYPSSWVILSWIDNNERAIQLWNTTPFEGIRIHDIRNKWGCHKVLLNPYDAWVWQFSLSNYYNTNFMVSQVHSFKDIIVYEWYATNSTDQFLCIAPAQLNTYWPNMMITFDWVDLDTLDLVKSSLKL